jgi:hypothetical protein
MFPTPEMVSVRGDGYVNLVTLSVEMSLRIPE